MAHLLESLFFKNIILGIIIASTAEGLANGLLIFIIAHFLNKYLNYRDNQKLIGK